MSTYLEHEAYLQNLLTSLKEDIFNAIINDPSFVKDNLSENSGTLVKNADYTKNEQTINITSFKVKQNNNVELIQTNGQSPVFTTLEPSQLLEIFQDFNNTPQKIAKIVEFTFAIRVVVPTDTTDIEIKNKAYRKLKDNVFLKLKIQDFNNDPVSLLEDDLSNPYDSNDIGNDG